MTHHYFQQSHLYIYLDTECRINLYNNDHKQDIKWWRSQRMFPVFVDLTDYEVHVLNRCRTCLKVRTQSWCGCMEVATSVLPMSNIQVTFWPPKTLLWWCLITGLVYLVSICVLFLVISDTWLCSMCLIIIGVFLSSWIKAYNNTV